MCAVARSIIDARVSVSIVVPIHNHADLIARVVKRLRTATSAQTLLEIVVIDDGSTDGTSELYEQLSEHIDVWQRQEHQGRAAAVRAGITRVLGEVVLVVNVDAGGDPAEHRQVLEPILTGVADVAFGCLPGSVSRTAALQDANIAFTAFRVEVLDDLDLATGFEVEPQLVGMLVKRASVRWVRVATNTWYSQSLGDCATDSTSVG